MLAVEQAQMQAERSDVAAGRMQQRLSRRQLASAFAVWSGKLARSRRLAGLAAGRQALHCKQLASAMVLGWSEVAQVCILVSLMAASLTAG